MKMDQTPALKNRLRAEQMLALFQNVALGVIGAAAAALVLASAMIHLGALDWTRGVSWISYIFACAAAHHAGSRIPQRIVSVSRKLATRSGSHKLSPSAGRALSSDRGKR